MNIFGITNNLDLLTVGIAIAVVGILGFVVYFNNRKSITNRTFLYISLVSIAWGAVNYLNYQFNSEIIVLLLLRLVIFFAVWYAFFLFQFFYVFPEDNFIFPKWYKFLLLPLVLIVSFINLTPLVFKDIAQLAPAGQVSKAVIAPGILFFALISIFLIIGTIILLIKKIWMANKMKRIQYRFVFLGAFITFSLHIIFNFILPAFFDNQRFIPLGAIFTFPFAVFTAYSIIRHKLFNIKVIGTALLVFGLSIVSLIEVTLADNFALIVYRSSVFFFILVFGIILLRSVLKEVQQREQIEKMAEDVRKAYEVEKKAKEELEQLDKTKNQFLLLIQHNLRTPLTSMRGYVDLLLNGTFGKQNKKTTEVIKKFQDSTVNLIKMVNDFLDITQFQLGKDVLAIKPDIPLGPLLDEIISELTFQAESKGVYLKIEKLMEKSFSIPADRSKLKAALFNIVDNAIKYTPKGGVTIKLQNHDTAKIIISDTGIGMSSETLKNLFSKMFERSEQAKKTAAIGSGIGLYLACQIIKSHNGKIWAESEGEGKGSTFHIELPLVIGSHVSGEPKSEVAVKNL